MNTAIGLVIAIVRGHTSEETLVKAYEMEKVDIPRAPAWARPTAGECKRINLIVLFNSAVS